MLTHFFFKCVSCEKYKLKNSKTYEIHLRGTGYEIKKYMCEKCGDETAAVYEEGKKYVDGD